jgi:transposase-like protein
MYTHIKRDGSSQKCAVYVLIGVDGDGYKDVLGMWIKASEGAKEWLKIFEEVKARGVKRVSFISMDGITGAEEAAKAAFEGVTVQRCLVHIMRNSLKYIPAKQYAKFCSDAKKIYQAVSLEQAREKMEDMQKKWEEDYPGAVKVWERNFRYVEQLFEYPSKIRKIIYTTNAIEAVNSGLRKVTDRKGALPSEESLMKLLYLRVMDMTKKWTKAMANWALVRAELDIVCLKWNNDL